MESILAFVNQYKKELRDEQCKLTQTDTRTIAERRLLPKAVHEGKLLYLGYGRNAWHSTWVRQYYPGSLSFFEEDLQKRCETLRVQGSVFRIEPVSAVFIEYENDVVILVAINGKSASAYESMVDLVLPFCLDGFWGADEFFTQNWLIPFKIKAWRPDLFPKKYHRMTSFPQGSGRPMAWQRQEVDETAGGICEAFRNFMPNLLRIKGDQGKF